MQMQLLTWQVSVRRVKPSADDLVATYNTIAQMWDRKIQRLGYDRGYRRLFARLGARLLPASTTQPIGHAAASRHRCVLDCGVGTGALSLALRASVPGLLDLHGVDLSSGMVAAAQRRFAEHGLPIQADVQDIRHVSHADASFDLVMSAHTLEHLPDPHAALREMVRVLRPGAPLLLITTRHGPLGWLLDAKWGLHRVDSKTLQHWLYEIGLTGIEFHPLPGPPWCRWMSVACVGWKRKN